jgi:hypothetical protein
LFYFLINIIGLGLGPTLIGALSDYLTPSMGSDALSTAMLWIIPIATCWGGVHFYIAGTRLGKAS